MKHRALLFDYDGLLAETESVDFECWREVYRDHGQELSVQDWLGAVGHVDNFDPRTTLEDRVGHTLDWAEIDPPRVARHLAQVRQLPALPGARELMEAGRARGFRIAVVSNSTRDWVVPGVERLGLMPLVDAVITREDAPKPKPDPAPYRVALQRLDAGAKGSFAFEDSHPGVLSASAAGLTVVAVPNALTRHQDLSAADLLLPSLAEFSLTVFEPSRNRSTPDNFA